MLDCHRVGRLFNWLGLTVLIFLVALADARAALDAPHDASSGTGCLSCHQMTSTYPKLLPPLGHPAQNIDDTIANNSCWSCHNDTTAPFVQTHSSLQTDNGYGNWSVECWVCHNQHMQEQNRYNGSTYGKYIRRSVNLAKITGPAKTGTKSVVFRGQAGPNSFADGDPAAVDGICEVCHTLTSHWRNDGTLAGVGAHAGLKGSNCPSCHPHDKGFKAECDICHGFPPLVNTPQAGDGLVVTPSATGSATAGWHAVHATSKRVYVFACDTCHFNGMPATPVSGNNRLQIGFSGRALLAGDGTGTKYQGQALNPPYGYEATNNTTITVDGSTTCVNIYCHSIGQRPDGQPLVQDTADYSNPKWNETVIAVPMCSYCHQGSPPSGSHPKHLETMHCNKCHYAYLGGASQCSYCHNSHPPPGYPLMLVNTALHVNREVNVGIISPYGGTYNGTPAPGDGFSTCTATYCHGNYAGSGLNAAPTWGNAATGACGTCHGASNVSDSAPQSGSHEKHADMDQSLNGTTRYGFNRGYQCTLCHKNLVEGTGPTYTLPADKTQHINRLVDWAFDTTDTRVSSALYGTATGTNPPTDGLAPNRAFSTCSNVYCHSIVQTGTGGMLTANSTDYTTPTWGSAPSDTSCGTCHKPDNSHHTTNPMDSGSHTVHVSYQFTAAMRAKRCSLCHDYSNSTSPITEFECGSCHLNGEKIDHVDGEVDVRFATSFTGADATYNGTPAPGDGFASCSNTYCHSDGTGVATAVVPGNTTTNWGSGSIACTSCHANGPDYANGFPKANSHQLPGHAVTCNYCHNTTTSDGAIIASKSTHVNRVYNVDAGGGVTFTYTYASTGGTCASVSCHAGGVTRVWGSQ